MTLSNETLLKLNQKGFIPGPKETPEAFSCRVDYCLHLKKTLKEEWGGASDEMPISQALYARCLQEGADQVFPLFDFSPMWVPLFFSNEKLSLWQGGCAWIFQKNEETPPGALLQLRKSWAYKERLYGIYSRRELIGHEMAHIGRMAFNEPRFEEFFAYEVSPSRLRRLAGPFFESSKETLFFLLCLLIPLLSDAFIFASGLWNLYASLLWLKAIPLVYLAWGSLRLAYKWRILKKAREALQPLVIKEAPPDAALYRLTDAEILLFSKGDRAKILAYAKENATTSLRWQLLWNHYFIKSS